MFLALLGMVRLQAIQLRQDRLFGDILLRKHTGFEAVVTEPAVRDDWR
jgi:chromatin segregation and condensation protein Rec8/ScpA/Scc1 (kleisin family)